MREGGGFCKEEGRPGRGLRGARQIYTGYAPSLPSLIDAGPGPLALAGSRGGALGLTFLHTHFVTAGNTLRCYIPRMDNAAFVALNRFGLGRRPEEPLPGDPRAWLRTQLQGPDTTPSDGLPDTAGAMQAVGEQLAALPARPLKPAIPRPRTPPTSRPPA